MRGSPTALPWPARCLSVHLLCLPLGRITPKLLARLLCSGLQLPSGLESFFLSLRPPPQPFRRLHPPRGESRTLLGVGERGRQHLCWAGTSATVWHRREVHKLVKDTGMFCPRLVEDVEIVVLSVLAGSSLSPSLTPRSAMLYLALPSTYKSTVCMP